MKMNQSILTKPKRKTAAEYEVLADQLLADMKRIDELMQKDRLEIEYFKAETARLEVENQVVLNSLKSMW